MKNLIIESPNSQSFRQKYTSLILTFLFWIIWSYVWTPILILIFFYFEMDIRYFDAFTYTSFINFLDDLLEYCLYIIAYCVVFFVWINYNIFRFKDFCRYKPKEDLTINEQSSHSKLDSDCLEECYKIKVLSATFDAQDNLINLRGLPNINPLD